MREIEYTYNCHICGKKGLTGSQLENPSEYGWTMETDPPEDPGGYSVFRVYCPDCSDRLEKGELNG